MGVVAPIACSGCGALFEQRDGPTHSYMESSPGCWAAFGEILAREYGDLAYAPAHRLTVDTYAVQHPGHPSPQSIQSVALHLISLCLMLERRLEADRATDAMRAAAEGKTRFTWLTPPPCRGTLTIADVLDAPSGEDHQRRVRAWAASAWRAWSPHHALIRAWLPGRRHR